MRNFKNGMMKWEAKEMAYRSGCITDWQTYCKLRHHLTKLNKKKKVHNETKINDMKNDSKNLWSIFNEILGK